MRAEHPSPDTLFDVVHGLSDPALRATVLDHVRSCARCAEEMRVTARTREILRGQVPGVTRGSRDTRPGTWRVRAPRVAAAVAAVAAGLALWWLGAPRSSSPDGSVQYWLEAPSAPVVLRREASATPLALQQALQVYDTHDAHAAVVALRASHPPPLWQDLHDVYLASALINADQWDEAARVLDTLEIDTLPYEYRQPARWMRYQILGRRGASREAETLLRALANDPGPIGERARHESESIGQGKP